MIRRLYVAFSPTPLLLFALLLVYMGTLEGWGAWAAAPMILPTRAESARWRTLLATSAVLSGSVAIWLLVRGLTYMF